MCTRQQFFPSTEEIGSLLRTKYAIFTGTHDKIFRSLIIFPDVGLHSLPDECFSLLMQYFYSLPSLLPTNHISSKRCVALIDRRSSDWCSVQTTVSRLSNFAFDFLEQVYVLKPQGILQRIFIEHTMQWVRNASKIPVDFVDHLTDLLSVIDSRDLPTDVGGQLLFNVEDWIRDQMIVETFRNAVEEICTHGIAFMALISTSEASSNVENITTTPDRVFHLNPFYAPHVVHNLRKRRHQWLNAVSNAETEGLRLRETLRSATDSISRDTESNSVFSHSDDPTHGPTFNLPVDRIFHIITLEHTLVRLTEARSNVTSRWKQYKGRARVVRLLSDVENRFDELQSLLAIWENLLESAVDYEPVNSKRMTKPSNTTNNSSIPMNDFLPVDVGMNGIESDDEVNLEGLDALLSRLREAEQFGMQLTSELEALSQTSKWLVSGVREETITSSSYEPVHPEWGHLGLQSDSESDSEVPLGFNNDRRPDLPALRLPTISETWSVLFDQLIELAKTKLPTAVDQLSRLHELHTEIFNARDWLRRGLALVDALTPKEKISALTLTESRKHLDELTSFWTSREACVKVLVDPKQFHVRFAGVVSADMRLTLRELLKEIEDEESSCTSLIAALQQHISRSTYPRHPPSPPLCTVHAESKLEHPEPNSNQGTPSHLPSVPNEPSTKSTTLTHFDSSSVVSSPARRLQLAWMEFVETERTYVNFLQHIYDVIWLIALSTEPNSCGTSTTIPDEWSDLTCVPSSIRDNPELLLVNWPDLLFFHRDCFLPTLEDCDNDVKKLRRLVLQTIPRFVDLYSVYCSFHPIAVQVAVQLEQDRVYGNWMSACSQEISRRETFSATVSSSTSTDPNIRPMLKLSSRLVTPVQRFQRYHLLVGQLLRLALTETDRYDLTEAHKATVEMCEIINLTMRLRCLSLRPSELGSLLLRGDFGFSREDSRSTQQRHVFLFTNAILVSKFRASGSAVTNTRSSSFSPMHSSVGDLGHDARERVAGTGSLSNVPLVSNLASIKSKQHSLLPSSCGLSGVSMTSCDSGPVYEVREELLLAHIGLTPYVRSDRRRFAIWTANRAQTYVFHSSDPQCRDQWVRTINDLLMGQLRRLRDEALQHHHTPAQLLSLSTVNQADRSSSLPVPTGVDLQGVSVRSIGSVVSLPGSTAKETKST